MNNTNAIVKDNSLDDMFDVLEKKGIDRIYHFTDERNINSINECNCLYSWAKSLKEGINIPFPGGNNASRNYDCMYGLENYVRLSFCKDHPMMWRLKKLGYKLVMIEFSLDLFKETVFGFSDKNAAAHDHKVGFGPAALNLVNLELTQRRCRSGTVEFGFHQAEILVEGKLPLDFVIRAYRLYL